jgi:hypothetical protein
VSICFTSRRNEWHRISKIRRQLEKKSLIHITKKRLTWVIRQRAKRTSRGDESIGDLLFMVRKSLLSIAPAKIEAHKSR